MTFFESIFTCNSNKNDMKKDIDDLKDRITKLEIEYSGLKDILIEIKMDIRLLHMEIKNNN